ncbi:MAG: methyltransferase domain-containing protein [Gemmataceae bacterium]
MNYLLHGMTRAISESFHLPGPILEIGSYQVPGQEDIGNLRTLFPGREYIGMDMREGPGVDLVARVEAIPKPDASIGTVIALSTFEHVKHFWKGFDEIKRVLRPDGALLVACPFYFYIHNYPDDYWRFTPAALQVLLEEYPHKILGWHGSKNRPANVWSLAFRSKAAAIAPEQFAKYKRLLDEYAREPMPWKRRLSYRVASWFLGRGPFAPFLEQNRVETVCHSS